MFSEPAQFPVLAKLLSSQPDVDDEMGFRKHLRRIVSFLSDLDDASDFLRAAVCFIRSTSSTRADRHNQLAARSATGGSTATAARASKCILALIGFSIIGPLTAPLRMTACSQVQRPLYFVGHYPSSHNACLARWLPMVALSRGLAILVRVCERGARFTT